MSTLSFYPWFCIDQKHTFSQFRLIPFHLGGQNDPEIVTHFTDISNILANYISTNRKPVSEATVLGFGNKGLTDDLTEPEIQEVFIYSEIVALAGLVETVTKST